MSANLPTAPARPYAPSEVANAYLLISNPAPFRAACIDQAEWDGVTAEAWHILTTARATQKAARAARLTIIEGGAA